MRKEIFWLESKTKTWDTLKSPVLHQQTARWHCLRTIAYDDHGNQKSVNRRKYRHQQHQHAAIALLRLRLNRQRGGGTRSRQTSSPSSSSSQSDPGQELELVSAAAPVDWRPQRPPPLRDDGVAQLVRRPQPRHSNG